MKFIGIWILNPLKTSGGQPMAWKHAVSHVPRVYAFGHGNTSRRTPLIILVFGEFGASACVCQEYATAIRRHEENSSHAACSKHPFGR